MRRHSHRSLLAGSLATLLALGCRSDASTAPGLPSAPASVTATAVSGNDVKLTWSAVTGATAYVVRRSTGSTPPITIGTTASTEYTDTGLLPGVAYTYGVATVRGSDTSRAVATAVVTTRPAGSAVQVLTGNITSTRQLTADTLYVLSGYVKVRQGGVLKIAAGTRIVGDTTAPGSSLWITRGGRIEAAGTAQAPIVFTSQRAPGTRAPGDWGGIIFVGNAVVNRSAGGGVATMFTEGPQGSGQNVGENYGGGTNPNDDQGFMRYVRIEFAGYAVLPDQELNSLSMYAVGRGTRFEYIQTLMGLDDSFEWFGGSVDMRYLVSYESGDDHFDWTEGFNGRVQYLIGLQTFQPTPRPGAGFPSADPRGFEGDGCELDKAGCTSYLVAPLSQPVFANFTLIGTGPGVFPGTVGTQSNGAVIRRGSGGTFLNGIIARWQNLGWNVRDAQTDTLRQRDSLTVAGVLVTDNGAGNFDPPGSAFGQASNFPGAISGTAPASSLVVSLPAAGVVPTIASLDWALAPASAARSTGVSTLPARAAARVTGFFGGSISGTPYSGAADPSGARWWEGWTSYARN